MPYGLTERGRETIGVCGLDRPGLLDLYAAHVVDRVRPRLDQATRVAEDGNAQATYHAWSTAKRALLATGQEYRALSFDALKTLGASLMLRHDLTLEWPG